MGALDSCFGLVGPHQQSIRNFSLWHQEYVTNGFLYTVEPLSKYTPEMRTLFYFLQVQRNPDSIEVSVNSLRGMS